MRESILRTLRSLFGVMHDFSFVPLVMHEITCTFSPSADAHSAEPRETKMADKFNEPNRFEVIRSFDSADNTRLARAVFPLNAWGTYDRHQAHTWALRLIKADPKTGEDVAAALINYDYMIPAAKQQYASNPRRRSQCDATLAAYVAWKSAQTQQAAA